jgi:tetratricopeptide (TPR) repeat protein
MNEIKAQNNNSYENRDKTLNQQGEAFSIAFAILLIGGLIWVIFDQENEFAWIVFQLGLFGFFIFFAAIPHEIGHIVGAILTKTNIFQVNIGIDKILFIGYICGIESIIHAIPFCGYTVVGYDKKNYYRLKKYLVTLGGPLSNLFQIIIAIYFLYYTSSYWLSAIINSFIAANIFELLLSLYPKKYAFSGIISPSDGLVLLTIPFVSKSKINQDIELNYVWEIYSYYKKGQFEDAKHSYQEGIALFPNSFALQSEMGKAFLRFSKPIEAKDLFFQVLKINNIDLSMKASILNSIATADIMIGDNNLLKEADEYSKFAYENMPWQTEFKWTRGMVLMKKGDKEKGLNLLREIANEKSDIYR